MCTCHAALPQPPADFFNLGAVNAGSEAASASSTDSQKPQAGGQPPAVLRYGMPPMPMFRPPVGMIPPHLPMGPGGPRRPPPPPPRMGGPPPGGPFPPGTWHRCDRSFTVNMLVTHLPSCFHKLEFNKYELFWPISLKVVYGVFNDISPMIVVTRLISSVHNILV